DCINGSPDTLRGRPATPPSALPCQSIVDGSRRGVCEGLGNLLPSRAIIKGRDCFETFPLERKRSLLAAMPHCASPGDEFRRRGCVSMLRSTVAFMALACSQAFATLGADVEDVEKLIRTGRYDEAARLAGEAIASGSWNERFGELKIE